MDEPRRVGRPSKLYGTIREARCPECGDWIGAGPPFRIHFEAEHPVAQRPVTGELREIPIADRIVQYVAGAVPLDAAAGACGIGARTVFAWMAVGEEWADVELELVPEDRVAFRRFADAVNEARVAAEARHMRAIERAGEKDWKARAWIMERARADRYGRVDRLRVAGDPGGEPIRVVHEETDPDFIAEVMAIYRGAGVIPDEEPGTASS